MGAGPREKFDNPVVEWIDSRLPVFTLMNKEYGVFPTPRNFNYFWNFGAIAMVMLITMILTGIFLAMNYAANTELAFDSVERIMRDVNFGWLIRYIHMNGASFFFIAVYIHIFRGMYYGSYKRPRELLWMLGVLIFLLMMATAFMGYVLPWGQMSYWGATVITNLFSAIPLVGDSIVTLLWGGFSVDNPTLNRFFALHYLLPFLIFAVVFLHVWALHVTGSNNPLGVEPKTEKDTLPFHPYYTIKDTFGLLVFLIIFSVFVFYAPDYMGHPDNYTPANPLVTPAHIVPEWYFLPFYAMLRSITFGINPYLVLGVVFAALAMWPVFASKETKDIPLKRTGAFFAVAGLFIALGYFSQFKLESGGVLLPLPFADMVFVNAKLGGVLVMFGSIALLFLMPFLDWHPLRSARFRPFYKLFLIAFVIVAFILGMAGGKPAEGIWVYVAQICTGYYLAFFLVILPFLSRFEEGRSLPPSIYDAVMADKKSKQASISAPVKKTPANSKGKGRVVKSILVLSFALLTFTGASALASEDSHSVEVPEYEWEFAGPFGTFDRASMQRGLKVYRQVCSACHSLKRVRYGDLTALGYDEAQVKNIAAEYTVTDGPNDEGDMYDRPARPSDAFVSPYANDAAGKYANNGALPPDLSLIIKARPNGANYVRALLTGYEEPPHGTHLQSGQNWNKYMSGHVIAMAPPLSDGIVAYEDGSPDTAEQYAHDVVNFLTWAADPYMEERKRTGIKVIFFLIVFAGVMYGVKKKIWAELK